MSIKAAAIAANSRGIQTRDYGTSVRDIDPVFAAAKAKYDEAVVKCKKLEKEQDAAEDAVEAARSRKEDVTNNRHPAIVKMQATMKALEEAYREEARASVAMRRAEQEALTVR